MDYRIEQLRYLLREDPSSRIFYQLGELLRREGEAAEAAAVLTSGLERHPRYVAAWVSLGRARRDLGELEGAQQAFRTALDLDRENPVAARLLGETAMVRADWLEAVKALKLTRALAGADDELDAEIALVERHLDSDGRLEAPPARPTARQTASKRVLEVVSLSADDPFASGVDDDAAPDAASDVFELVEAPVETVAEATAEAGTEAETEAEAAAEAGTEAVAVAEAGAEAGAEPEAEVQEAPVDEGSVGAWSATTGAAGVASEDAWAEPTAELEMTVVDGADETAWSEPSAPPAAAGAGAGAGTETGAETEAETGAETETETETGAETGAETETGPETGPETVAAAEPEGEPEPAAADEPTAAAAGDDLLPGDDRGPDETGVTRPIPVDRVMAGMPEPPAADGPAAEETPEPERRPGLEHGLPLPTMTLARLALDQGDRPLAMATLESLLERDPGRDDARVLLDELRGREAEIASTRRRAARATARVDALQGWLDAVRLAAERRVP